jgi:hypothetical protein
MSVCATQATVDPEGGHDTERYYVDVTWNPTGSTNHSYGVLEYKAMHESGDPNSYVTMWARGSSINTGAARITEVSGGATLGSQPGLAYPLSATEQQRWRFEIFEGTASVYFYNESDEPVLLISLPLQDGRYPGGVVSYSNSFPGATIGNAVCDVSASSMDPSPPVQSSAAPEESEEASEPAQSEAASEEASQSESLPPPAKKPWNWNLFLGILFLSLGTLGVISTSVLAFFGLRNGPARNRIAP